MVNIIDLLAQGKIEGFSEVPERIDTTVSHIFIFKNARKVFKLYRRDNSYWNSNFSDLSGGVERASFIKEDFHANSTVNPLVYTDLKTAHVRNGSIYLKEVDETNDELVIIMNQVETSLSFMDSLFYGKILEEEYVSIGEQCATIKNTVVAGETQPSDAWYELLTKRLRDLDIWMENLDFPKADTAKCIQKLQTYVTKNRERFSRNELVYSIDGHGENALYHEGRLQFIDVLWPYARWRWTPKEYDIFRLGADIFAFTDEHTFNSYIAGAKTVYTDFDETDKEFYLLYSAALDSCVLKTLTASKPEKDEQLDRYYTWFLDRLNGFGDHV